MNIDIKGISLNYESLGTGAPLVLIGGLSANCREWSHIEKALAQTFTVYKPENRGAGHTEGWKNAFSIEEMATDISLFLEALSIDDAYVVGHSMGGAILQRLCIMHPTRIKAAIMASSFARFPYAAQLYIENTAALLEAGLALELVVETICTRLYASEFLSNKSKLATEFKRILNDPVPQTPEGYSAQVKAIAKFDTHNDLSKIQCPTLILNGTEDILTPSYLSEELHQAIKNSKLVLLPKCGHMIPQEKPNEFTQTIIDFFSER